MHSILVRLVSISISSDVWESDTEAKTSYLLSVDILDDMLAGVGWTMQDYLKHGENDYYPPLPNGHRLFLHDIRRVAVRCAVAMGEEGDIVVSSLRPFFFCCPCYLFSKASQWYRLQLTWVKTYS